MTDNNNFNQHFIMNLATNTDNVLNGTNVSVSAAAAEETKAEQTATASAPLYTKEYATRLKQDNATKSNRTNFSHTDGAAKWPIYPCSPIFIPKSFWDASKRMGKKTETFSSKANFRKIN